MVKRGEVKKRFARLVSPQKKSHIFPKIGESLKVPIAEAVYIILSPKNEVVHVGSTGAAGGILRRLRYHLSGDSSFAEDYLGGNGKRLRGKYKFKYIEEEDEEIRAYLKAYAIVNLWPKYIDVD